MRTAIDICTRARRRLVLLTAVVAALSAAAGIGAVATRAAFPASSTVDFDRLPDKLPLAPNTTLSDQYRDAGGSRRGVLFGPEPLGSPRNLPTAVAVEGGLAHSGTQVAKVEMICPGVGYECARPYAAMWAFFPYTKERVVAYVGSFVGGQRVTAVAYDADGRVLGQRTVSMNASSGFVRPIGFGFATPRIAYLELRGPTASEIAESGGSHAPFGVDDLSFDSSRVGAPSFGMLSSRRASVKAGGSETTMFTIRRQNGARGPIALSASAPAGLHVSFEPRIATSDGDEPITMTVAADSDFKPATGASLSVFATPASRAAGPHRSFQFSLTVVPPA